MPALTTKENGRNDNDERRMTNDEGQSRCVGAFCKRPNNNKHANNNNVHS